MADSSYDYFFSGPHDDARRLIDQALVHEGYRLEAMPNGTTKAVRGSLAASLLVGGLAGRGFHVVLYVQYFVDDHDRLVARISRELGLAAVKGGAIGAARAHSAFVEAATALGHAAAWTEQMAQGGWPGTAPGTAPVAGQAPDAGQATTPST
ncbi:hypothetical protein EDF38_0181 [Frigoribacterium sp. PhB160]|uniref:hypothetical protein n=1 Tax=Frigoribacterium sp. PhB160 TaxID=2485192 RepID=UPI000F4680C5|nr:hypothetical protein [Frigoribacterium sp. PhB160]ROS61099.1 hypothetical protein EDF38_0181 [Frigoribacterium sp. PhB160]